MRLQHTQNTILNHRVWRDIGNLFLFDPLRSKISNNEETFIATTDHQTNARAPPLPVLLPRRLQCSSRMLILADWRQDSVTKRLLTDGWCRCSLLPHQHRIVLLRILSVSILARKHSQLNSLKRSLLIVFKFLCLINVVKFFNSIIKSHLYIECAVLLVRCSSAARSYIT